VGSSAGDFRRWLKRDSREAASLSEETHCRGPQGRLLYWGPWVMSRGLWRRVSVFMEAQLGSGLICWGLWEMAEKGLWRWSVSLSMGTL